MVVFAAATLVGACTGKVGEIPSGSGGASSPTPGGGGAAVTTGSGGAGNAVVSGSGGSGVVITGAAGGGVTFCDTRGVAVTSQVPRLSNAQYDRVINDLLGVQTLTAANGVQPSTILATDQAGGLTDLGWSSYQTVADMVATQVMADATLKKNFMKCTPTGDGKQCLHDTIVAFGRKAFRRPLTTDELARFDKVVSDGPTITATGSVNEIAQTVLYMFLVSPSFLTRGEMTQTADASGNYPLSGTEVAQRLSFMLWGSIPDDALNTAADNSQLSTPAQILTQAQRMLMSDKARLKIADFHRSYILMGPNTRWDTANKDTTLFPAFSTNLVPTLMAETEKFFDAVAVGKKGTFQDLFLSPTAFVTASTAPLYGLAASGFGTDFKETALDANQRPGFLTRVGFLNAYAFYNRTSPIHRGAFIMKQVLGTPIGTPPPGAEATALPPATADLNTNRKQVDAQTTGGVCETCHHGYINPAGFSMEEYNAVGTWQTKEQSSGAAIDTAADVVIDGTSVHVNNAFDLMQKIAASPMAQHRYAERLTSYLYEREGDPMDCGTVNDLAAKIAPGGYTVLNLNHGPHPDSSVPNPSRRSDVMNRRVFLKGIGGVSLAAPFLQSVAEKTAKAQGTPASTPPKRLVIHFTHNGCLTNRWWPKVSTYTNGAATLTADMLMGQTLEPLAPYISKLSIPRGFRSMNAYGSGQSIDPHDQAMGSKLTCATIDSANKRYATAASLDHVIAKQINPNGAAPLVLSVGAASTAIKEILSFSAAGTAFPATTNPLTVYNQLTGVFGTGGTTTGGTGQAAYLVKRKQSVLDLCKADLQRYQALKMSKTDQGLVQNWMDLLRSTETGIIPTASPTSCSKTTAEAAPFNPPATSANVTAASPTGKITLGSVLGNTPDPVGDANLATSFTKGGDMLQNLIALTMICDTNRVMVMLYPGYVTFNWDGIMHTHEHHGLSHRTGDFTVGGACGVTGVLDMIWQIDKWYAGKYARLVGLLDSINESNGTLLDNTATMWLPELSDGAAHNLNNLPIVIAGKAGGYLKMGQVINVEGTGTPQMGNSDSSCANGGSIGNTGSSGGMLPINKLYVTLMNAVGCTATGVAGGGKVTTFGQFDGTGSSGGISNPGEVAKLTSAG